MKTFDEKRKQLLSFFNTEEESIQKSSWVDSWEEDSLEKGGEGSRGGTIIGHTKTGKPIYSRPNHSAHKEFTSEDHRDAAAVHQELHNQSVQRGKEAYNKSRDLTSKGIHDRAAKAQNTYLKEVDQQWKHRDSILKHLEKI